VFLIVSIFLSVFLASVSNKVLTSDSFYSFLYMRNKLDHSLIVNNILFSVCNWLILPIISIRR
jgi:hypothetical protein